MSNTPIRVMRARAGSAVLTIIASTLAMLTLAAGANALPVSTPGLPDGRGYEKVSPTDNADSNVYQAWPITLANEGGWTRRPFKASADGNAVAYVGGPSEEGGTGSLGGNYGDQYLARREGDGKWTSEDITPPSEEFLTNPLYQGFTANLSYGFLTTKSRKPLTPGAPADNYRIPYTRDIETGAYQSLMSTTPPDREPSSFGAFEVGNASKHREPVIAGYSADLSHILYIANDALTPEAIDEGPEANNLYDYEKGTLRLVNVLPSGTPEPYALYGGAVLPPAEPNYNAPDFSHVISSDGSRIFWTGQGANPNLYMREDDSRTVQVDTAVGGKGQFWTATPDGSKVLFTKAGDLYMYSVETGETSDLTSGAEVQGVVGTSEDLSYIYFVADAALAEGASPGNCAELSIQDQCSLYVLHAGEPVRFVARLSGEDNVTAATSFYEYNGDWQGGLANKEAQVSADGRHLLFSSIESLTGYENEKTEQLFVYEYGGNGVDCISCDRSGAPPIGRAEGSSFSAFLPVSNEETASLNWMSADGDRVFFDSREPLVPQDTNGRNDVYEWEHEGINECTEERGCIYLISGGTAPEGSYMIDSSLNGNDVFFTTRAKLVGEDQNENIDVYDAHVGAVTPSTPPQCTGTGCQGLPSSPPIFATPSSVTYNGVGNFPVPANGAVKTKKDVVKKKKRAINKRKKKHKDGRRAKRSRNFNGRNK
ncbi:MAG: hypothetical protein WB998_03565 [Solirubrobacteraceae bacterium]